MNQVGPSASLRGVRPSCIENVMLMLVNASGASCYDVRGYYYEQEQVQNHARRHSWQSLALGQGTDYLA